METPTLTDEERQALEDVRFGYGDIPLARRTSTDDEPQEPSPKAA